MSTRLFYIICLVLIALVGNVQAVDTTWTDADPGDSLWSTPGNWDTGNLPTTADWAKVRNGLPGPTIANPGAVAQKVHMGYSESGALTVVDGGTLTIAEDVLLGKNGGTGTLNMLGGTIDCGRDLEVGEVGDLGIINMTGGTIIVGDDFMIPEDPCGTAEVNINGGTITLGGDLDMDNVNEAFGSAVLNLNRGTITVGDDLEMDAVGSAVLNLNAGTISVNDDIQMAAGGSMDIKFGTLIIGDNGTDNSARLATYIANEWITGFGIVGNVTTVNDGDTITVTATSDPLARTPTMDAYVYIGNVDLSWVNLDPNNPADDVWVDVYFGADGTLDPNAVIEAGKNLTGHTVSAPDDGGEYVWRVDTYRYGDPAIVYYGYDADPNTDDDVLVDEGVLMHFTAISDFPVESLVIDTPPTVTWANEPIPSQATVYDDGVSAVTVTWTADDPNAVFSTPVTVIPAQADYTGTGVAVFTDVTVDYHAAQFTVTATATDSSIVGGPASDSVGHDCADNPCQAARAVLGYDEDYPGDLVADCEHDLADFAAIAAKWLVDYALTEPSVMP